jgi:hypothetical protein
MLTRAIETKSRVGAPPDLVDRLFGPDGWGRVVAPLGGALLGDVLADMSGAHPVVELGFIAAVAVVVFLLIQWAMSLRERRRSTSPIRVAFAGMPPSSPQLDVVGAPLTNDVVKLSEFVGATPRLARRVFEDCDIFGPAVIWMSRAWLVDCTIVDDGQAIFIPCDEERAPAGTIAVEECLFRRCRFQSIGIAGSPDDLRQFRARLTPARHDAR